MGTLVEISASKHICKEVLLW